MLLCVSIRTGGTAANLLRDKLGRKMAEDVCKFMIFTARVSLKATKSVFCGAWLDSSFGDKGVAINGFGRVSYVGNGMNITRCEYGAGRPKSFTLLCFELKAAGAKKGHSHFLHLPEPFG